MSIVGDKNPLRIFISAGEFSGDLLGADLCKALRSLSPFIEIYGICGPSMEAQGVIPIASIDELSVMGIVEVAKKISDIRNLEKKILSWIDRISPDLIVLIDFPGFHLKLAEQLKLRQYKIVQYVAPKMWAWGQGRLGSLRDNFDCVLGVLPFEEEFFLSHKVNYVYVGSPHLDRVESIRPISQSFNQFSEKKILAFLPGSRKDEIVRLVPVMLTLALKVQESSSEYEIVVPIAPSVDLFELAKLIGVDASELEFKTQKKIKGIWWFKGFSLEIMKGAHAAVVASGTATLECALCGTPMVVIYAMSPTSYLIAKSLVRVKYASLVNLLMNKEVVPEHIQNLDVGKIFQDLVEICAEGDRRVQMRSQLGELTARLKPNAAENAAKVILKMIGRK